MSWTFKPALKHFERERENWNAINRQGTNHILLDADFVWALLRHFGDARVVLGTQSGGDISAITGASRTDCKRAQGSGRRGVAGTDAGAAWICRAIERSAAGSGSWRFSAERFERAN